MTAAAGKKPAFKLPILEGVLPIDMSRVPVDLIAGATLAALAIPETMGYSKIAGMPVITGLYTILLPILAFRPPRLVAPPGRWCRLRHRRHPVHRHREHGRRGRVAAMGRPGRIGGPDVRRRAHRCPGAASGLHRQLPVTQRAHRLSHRRGHTGGHGPARGCAGRHRRHRHDAPEVLQHPRQHPRHEHPHAARVAGRDRHDPGLATHQPGHPGSPHRSRRRHRPELRLRLRGARHQRAGHRPRRPAPDRPAGRDPLGHRAVDDHRVLAVHRHPRPERGDVAGLRHEVRRQLR